MWEIKRGCKQRQQRGNNQRSDGSFLTDIKGCSFFFLCFFSTYYAQQGIQKKKLDISEFFQHIYTGTSGRMENRGDEAVGTFFSLYSFNYMPCLGEKIATQKS